MKKLLVLLAVFMLVSACALAEVKLESTETLEYSISLSRGTNCYYRYSRGQYQICDAQGNPLSAVYSDLYPRQNGQYYLHYGSGLNYVGLLDAQGQVVAEPCYNKIYFCNENWALAFVLDVAAGDDYDYTDKNDANVRYILVRTDVIYKGKIIGSFTRDEFAAKYENSTYSCGDYLAVKTGNGSGFYISRDFAVTKVSEDFTTSEFTSVYKKGMFHNPTQQFAFCEGCTLTAEDVSYSVWYNDQIDSLVDLQGNVIKDELFFDSVRAAGDYLLVRRNSLYGVMDKQGNLIVKPTYKDIAYSYGLFTGEYQTALTPEGILHFIDKQGNVSAKVGYEGLTSSDYKGYSNNASFVHYKERNKYYVFTATHGELPTAYEEVATAKSGHKIIFVKQNGLWGAIDMAGNTVIPFAHKYAPEQTDDSSLVYGTDTENNRLLYHLSCTADAAAPAAPAPAADDGSWTCPDCNVASTGKFCGECGMKKPEATPAPAADDGSWTCTDCNIVNTGKFCPECGAKKPAAEPTPAPEPQCASCGYKPEGSIPKFCPECGTKF